MYIHAIAHSKKKNRMEKLLVLNWDERKKMIKRKSDRCDVKKKVRRKCDKNDYKIDSLR